MKRNLHSLIFRSLLVGAALSMGACASDPTIIEEPPVEPNDAPKAELNFSMQAAYYAADGTAERFPFGHRELESSEDLQHAHNVRLYVFRSETENGQYIYYTPDIRKPDGTIETNVPFIYLSDFEKASDKEEQVEKHIYTFKPALAEGYYKFYAIARDDFENDWDIAKVNSEKKFILSPLAYGSNEKEGKLAGNATPADLTITSVDGSPVVSEVFVGQAVFGAGEDAAHTEGAASSPVHVVNHGNGMLGFEKGNGKLTLRLHRAVAGILLYIENIPVYITDFIQNYTLANDKVGNINSNNFTVVEDEKSITQGQTTQSRKITKIALVHVSQTSEANIYPISVSGSPYTQIIPFGYNSMSSSDDIIISERKYKFGKWKVNDLIDKNTYQLTADKIYHLDNFIEQNNLKVIASYNIPIDAETNGANIPVYVNTSNDDTDIKSGHPNSIRLGVFLLPQDVPNEDLSSQIFDFKYDTHGSYHRRYIKKDSKAGTLYLLFYGKGYLENGTLINTDSEVLMATMRIGKQEADGSVSYVYPIEANQYYSIGTRNKDVNQPIDLGKDLMPDKVIMSMGAWQYDVNIDMDEGAEE